MYDKPQYRIKKAITAGISVMALVIGTMATTANAQSDDNHNTRDYDNSEQNNNNRDYDRNRDNPQSQNRMNDRRSNNRGYRDDVRANRDRNRRRTGQPNSEWVLIAYDIDNDRSFDAYEYILISDLQNARRRGNMRSTRSNDNRRMQKTNQRQNRKRRPRGFRMQGEIRDIKTANYVNMDEPHKIAKIDTRYGSVKADLGPAEDLRSLKLKDGDEVTVFGREGRVNDKRMLIATCVETQNDKVTIHRDRFNTCKKVEGRVASIRKTSFKGNEKDHRIARVQTRRGQIVKVDLGTAKSKLDVSEGDDVTVLGQCGRINGRHALFAHQIRINDGSIKKVARSDGRSSRYKGTQSNR